jgi:DNA-binding NarL/FixJ family response regulator
MVSAGRAMTSSRGGIEVALVEDDSALADGLRLLIDGTEGYACTQVFRSVEDALQGLRRATNVLLLDIHLPGMLGSEGVRLIRARFPATEVVMLTVYSQEDLVFESICNGACGYLLKQTPPAALLQAIAEASRGGAPMSPEIARKVVSLFRQVHPPPEVDHGLTPQETRLLGLLSEGHSYESAGANLNVSVNTVRNYVRSVYDKLHVHSKSEAVSKALRRGILR